MGENLECHIINWNTRDIEDKISKYNCKSLSEKI